MTDTALSGFQLRNSWLLEGNFACYRPLPGESKDLEILRHSGQLYQTYSRFLRWLIFAPYEWIPENLSGCKEIIQDIVLTK